MYEVSFIRKYKEVKAYFSNRAEAQEFADRIWYMSPLMHFRK